MLLPHKAIIGMVLFSLQSRWTSCGPTVREAMSTKLGLLLLAQLTRGLTWAQVQLNLPIWLSPCLTIFLSALSVCLSASPSVTYCSDATVWRDRPSWSQGVGRHGWSEPSQSRVCTEKRRRRKDGSSSACTMASFPCTEWGSLGMRLNVATNQFPATNTPWWIQPDSWQEMSCHCLDDHTAW